MKNIKLIFGLALSLGLLLSIGTIEKSTTTNAGWAVTKLCNSGEVVTGVTETGLSVAAGYEGAEIGAEIGWLGGPGGAVVGACVGWL